MPTAAKQIKALQIKGVSTAIARTIPPIKTTIARKIASSCNPSDTLVSGVFLF